MVLAMVPRCFPLEHAIKKSFPVSKTTTFNALAVQAGIPGGSKEIPAWYRGLFYTRNSLSSLLGAVQYLETTEFFE